VLVALLVGCGSTPTGETNVEGGADATPDDPPVTDAASEALIDDAVNDTAPIADATTDHSAPDTIDAVSGDVGTDVPPTWVGGSLWKATSRAVEIRTFNYWTGVSGYLQEREQLTTTQLAALDGLCLIPTPTFRHFDTMTYRITITERDGTKASYRASSYNHLDGNEGLPTVDIHSLEPFLATFSCVSSGSPTLPPPKVDGGPPWTVAPVMGTDPGCINGVFVPSGCRQAWVKLKVDAPLSTRLEVFECRGALSMGALSTLRLFTPDGATELAASNPASSSVCPYVDYAFARADTYVISIDRTAGTACDAGTGPAGDLLLRIRH